MKKYQRLYLTTLLFLCTLIPLLLLDKFPESEALRFFESFVEPSELSVDENGIVYWHYKHQTNGLTLKYADRLEFESNKKLSIDNIAMDSSGIMTFDATANSVQFSPKQGCLLLKYMDGVWYRISISSFGLDPPRFSPRFPYPVSYSPLVFLYYQYGLPFYSLPSGRYYLFIDTALPTDSNGERVGHGAALVEIELENLDKEITRFTTMLVAPSLVPQYSVTVVGETLHHDPYA